MQERAATKVTLLQKDNIWRGAVIYIYIYPDVSVIVAALVVMIIAVTLD